MQNTEDMTWLHECVLKLETEQCLCLCLHCLSVITKCNVKAIEHMGMCSCADRRVTIWLYRGLESNVNSYLRRCINDQMLHFLFVPPQADLQLPLNRRRQPPMAIHAQTWPVLVVQCGNCTCVLNCHHRLNYIFNILYLLTWLVIVRRSKLLYNFLIYWHNLLLTRILYTMHLVS